MRTTIDIPEDVLRDLTPEKIHALLEDEDVERALNLEDVNLWLATLVEAHPHHQSATYAYSEQKFGLII